MLRASWQGGIAIGLALLLCYCLNSVPAWAKSWMWRLVYAKFLVVVVVTHSLAIPILNRSSSGRAVSLGNQRGIAHDVAALPTDGTLDSDLDPELIVDSRGTSNVPNLAKSVANATIRDSPRSLLGNLDWTQGAFCLWVLGIATCLLSVWRHHRQLRQIQFRPINQESLMLMANSIASEFGLKNVPSIAASREVPSPMLIGAFRPVIVLPQRVVACCSDEQIEMILRHEMAHVRRNDLLWGWVSMLVEVLFFFHPMVWWASRRIRLVRELDCDRLAIGERAAPVSYADALLRVAQLSQEHRICCRSLGAACIFESSKSLSRRLIAMRNYRQLSWRGNARYAVALFVTGLIGIVPWHPVARDTN